MYSCFRAKVEHDAKTGIISLTIPQMFTDDVGEYTLKATNQHGAAQTSAQLLPKDQYDRWFTDEQSKLTRDRKQVGISKIEVSRLGFGAVLDPGALRISSRLQSGAVEDPGAPRIPGCSRIQKHFGSWKG